MCEQNQTNCPTDKTTAPLNTARPLRLIETIEHCGRFPDIAYGGRALTLENRVLLTVDCLSEHHIQEALATTYDVSQPTASHIISTFRDLIATQLEKHRLTPRECDTFSGTLVVDGTLEACWDCKNHADLYSDKHRTTGFNLQVACSLDGHLMWVSDSRPGSCHDLRCVRQSEFPDPVRQPGNVTADKGYLGWRCMHPVRKPRNRALSRETKEYNSHRTVIERVNAHLKN